MILKDLIYLLKQVPTDTPVAKGFGAPMSYRGYYERLAFRPVDDTTAGEMLRHAESAVGETFYGYKGGEYTMSLKTICHVADYGCTDGKDWDDEGGLTVEELHQMLNGENK
jgi:hypothetical protein